MKNRLISISAALLLASFAGAAQAQNMPTGWTKSDTGITKGNSKVTIGEVQDLGDQSITEFLSGLEKTAPDGTVFVSSGGIKDGKFVVQVKREITVDGTKARSVLMVCKLGTNENRLIEVFSENSKVLDLIGGAKYAITVCTK